jgi:hypothetical protein
MSVPFILAAFLVVAVALASASFSDSNMVVSENTASQTYVEITFVITSRGTLSAPPLSPRSPAPTRVLASPRHSRC